jgi:hypothetical protein
MSSDTKRVKLALLLCDTPIPTVQKTHGTYVDIFRTQLQASLPAGANVEFTLEGYDVVVAQEYPDLGDNEEGDGGYAGVLISGSGERRCFINRSKRE